MICAIDPSLSCTGVVIGLRAVWESWAFRSQPLTCGDLNPQSPINRVARIDGLVARILPTLENREIKAVYIEHYAYSKSQGGLAEAIEFGGVLRWHVADLDGLERLREVQPNTIKLFATGDGRASKEKVAAHVAKRWGHVFNTTDETDAFALWRLGCACEGIFPCETDEQAAACETVLKAKANRPRGKTPQLDLLLRA